MLGMYKPYLMDGYCRIGGNCLFIPDRGRQKGLCLSPVFFFFFFFWATWVLSWWITQRQPSLDDDVSSMRSSW